MKKTLATIILCSISALSYSNEVIEKILEEKRYSDLPKVVNIDDNKYSGRVPISVYLLLNESEELVVSLISDKLIDVSSSVMYKGSVYSDYDWALMNGYKDFASVVNELELKNESNESKIKRNRDEIFTNMSRLPSDIQKEKELIEKFKSEKFQEILNSKNKEEILLNLLIKLIIDGNNDAATIIANQIENVNALNKTGISPLMATGFTNKLEGGNVEFANKLIFEYNADVNFKNEENMTAVHISSAGNAFKTLTTLINNKAVFMSADKTGQLSIDYAIKANAEETLFILHKSIELLQRQRNIK
jgi:hypothetical protein